MKRSKGLLNPSDMPKYKPAVYRLFIVEDHLLALMKRKDDKYMFDVFDQNGNYVEELGLDFQPWINKRGYVYAPKISPDLSECEIVRLQVEIG